MFLLGADIGRVEAMTCPTWPTLLAWLENDLPDECREKLALMSAVHDVGQ